MKASHVVFGLPDGRSVKVASGGLIGRGQSMALRLEHEAVSDAHALIRQSGDRLQMLALRRWFMVGEERLGQVNLEPGQRISLTDEVVLEVLEVYVGEEELVLLGVREAPWRLAAPVNALILEEGEVVALPQFHPSASAMVWREEGAWHCRVGDGPPQCVEPGLFVELGGHRVAFVAQEAAGGRTTHGQASGEPPLRIVARQDTVHLHPSGRPSLVLVGISSRIVSELAELGTIVPWRVVARLVWPGQEDERLLRQNWDRNLRSLRGKLRRAGIREDLVRPDGKGNVELFLLPDDHLIDET